jgi:hypothetical protein
MEGWSHADGGEELPARARRRARRQHRLAGVAAGDGASQVRGSRRGGRVDPVKALGAACASCACVTASAFVDAWTNALSLRLNYQRGSWEDAP